MNNRKVRFIIVSGLLAIAGIITLQFILFKQAFNLEEKKFSQKVHIALLEVVKNLSNSHQNKIPLSNPVNQVSDDYYVVNVNYGINAEILELYLKNEFEKLQINTDYEYAIYDCETDKMVYGNYVNADPTITGLKQEYFPKFQNLVYYFAVRFPYKTTHLFASLNTWILLSVILMVILIIYVYSIFVILEQKRYSELQKDFINNMTHEFKTPLSSILIASSYLTNQPAIKNSEKLAKYTQTITSQSSRLNNNVEQILNLAKTEKNPLVLEKNIVNIAEIILLVIHTFKIKLDDSIIFNLNFKNEKYNILADEIHFSNVLYNIIDNSIKYSESTPEISIDIIEEKSTYKLKITDYGRGISKKHLKNVFKKFFRVPTSNKEYVNGFGLGLYYVKSICNLHRWTLDIDSEEHKSTTIFIIFPKFVKDA